MLRATYFLFAASILSAQPWSGLIDAGRAIDWSAVGIPGGIPARLTACATISAATYNNGESDATAGIQAALDGCASGQTVLLGPGVFRINSGVIVPSNVTLRGSGASNTTLDARGTSGAVVRLGANVWPNAANSTAITAGNTAGSSSIVVESATGITVGMYLIVTELNDEDFVTNVGSSGACTWCDALWSGTRVRGQIVEVTSVDGTTIGITPALYSGYADTPLATRFTAGGKYAGVENLKVYANETGYTTNFAMSGCAYCWISGVEGDYTDGDHVQVYFGFRDEIRNSYFHDGYKHTAGSTDTDVMLAHKTSGCLVENNIAVRLHISFLLNWGAAGNVIAYNYSYGAFDEFASTSLIMDYSVHAAHPQFNLWEGNIGGTLNPDGIWGSSSHNTAFRNWFKGTSRIAEPLGTRGAVDWGGAWWAVGAVRAINLDFASTSYNLIGNLAGSAEMAALTVGNDGTTPLAQVRSIVSPSTRSYTSTAYAFSFGYASNGDTGTNALGSDAPYTTALLHGNYSSVDSQAEWVEGLTQTLPASLYLSTKPAWWGVSAIWPSIGPDVTGTTGPGSHAAPIPAQLCYDNSPADGIGGILFDAVSCYASRRAVQGRATVSGRVRVQ